MPSAFVLIDIFENSEEFLKYLGKMRSVKEKHRNSAVFAEPKSAPIYDYEVIARIGSKNDEGVRRTIQKIRNYDGVKDIRVLPVVE